MRDDDYDYDYHNLAENADELYNDEYYYDDGSDEPWIEVDNDETGKEMIEDEYDDYMNKYNAYYHDIADEIDE